MPGKLICLDPGHGGKDSGAVGQDGTRESGINWAIAQQVQQKLVAAGYSTCLTKTKVETVKAPIRTERANDKKPRLFISIHCNSDGPTAKGFEVWYWRTSQTGKDTATVLCQKMKLAFPELRNRGLKVSPTEREIYVLHHTKMAAVLLECAFISNRTEEKLLNSPQAQTRFADAIVQAVKACI